MSTRIAALFVLAMTTVLVALGLVAASLGRFVLVGYLIGVATFLVLVGRRARAQREATRRDEGRTCQCCTTTVFDPVEIR